MWQWLQSLFDKDAKKEYKLALHDLEVWLDGQVSLLSFCDYLSAYYLEIKNLQEKLQQRVHVLSSKGLSDEDKRQVSGRVQNIVVGHRNHYLQEIKLFAQDIKVPEKGNFSSLKDFQEAIEFNSSLNVKLGRLAMRTEKSYHAAQHLFFEDIESIFRLLGELNAVVKNCTDRAELAQVSKIEQLYRLLLNIGQVQEKQKKCAWELNLKETVLQTLKKDQDKKEEHLQTLRESAEYRQFLELKAQKGRLETEINSWEDETFVFFAKLNKPLKKQEHIALNPKPLQPYLENAATALHHDGELKIILILGELKKNLIDGSLLFEEKQRKQFLELIEKAEHGYLKELQQRGETLQQKKGELEQEMSTETILLQTGKLERELQELSGTMNIVEKEMTGLQLLLETDEAIRFKEELQLLIAGIFKKEIKLVIS